MKSINLASLLAIALLQTGEANAAYESGNELLGYCTGTDIGQTYCLGFISATLGNHDAWVAWGKTQRLICQPSKATLQQFQRVIVKHLEAHPENLHLGANGLVLNGLMEAFPCKE